MKLLDDPRLIVSVAMAETAEDIGWRVGRSDVTRIRVYAELGEYGMLPWIAIYLHGESEPRIKLPARTWQIEYEAPPEAPPS